MKDLYYKIKNWMIRLITGRRYFMGFDPARGDDYSVKLYGYIDRKGVTHITHEEVEEES